MGFLCVACAFIFSLHYYYQEIRYQYVIIYYVIQTKYQYMKLSTTETSAENISKHIIRFYLSYVENFMMFQLLFWDNYKNQTKATAKWIRS